MGLASIRRRVERIERALRVPVTAPDAAARAVLVTFLTLVASDDGAWAEWTALSGGGAESAKSDPAMFRGLAAWVGAAETATSGAER